MAEFELPGHVVTRRRDGRSVVVLHRSMAIIEPQKVEIKNARSTLLLPIIGLGISVAAGFWLIASAGQGPFWLMVLILMGSLFIVPASIMGLVGSIAGANVVIDQRKGSLTIQQGYLGMGIGTSELVPFHKFDFLEITIEGDQPDRWREQTDTLRQFAVVLQKKSGKRRVLARVPVTEGDQADGMDRSLAVANAIAAIAGCEVRLPQGWELIEVDLETGEPTTVAPAPAAASAPAPQAPGRPASPKKERARGRRR